MEVKYMRTICAVSIMDRVRNNDVCRKCGSEISIGERMDSNVCR
jgi:ribosomal protein L40E